ncbi:MAG: M28 family peptidase [Ignavibacteriaceae bacterium]
MKNLILLLFSLQILIFPQKEKISGIFSKDEILNTIEVLGNDSLEGRGTGTRGEERAAEYITRQLKKINIAPLDNGNSYNQYIPLLGNVPLVNSDLKIYSGKEIYKCKLDKDYLMFTAGEQTFIPNPVPLVFVGYGIIAPEFDYNDYQSIDVEGKIAVMLLGEPASDDPGFFYGKDETIYSRPDAKQRMAISRGASGSIIIPYKEHWDSSMWENYKVQFAFENVKLPYNASDNFSILFNPDSAGKIFSGSNYSLEDIYNMLNKNGMKSFPLKTELSFSGSFREREFTSKNIIGFIEGSDPVLKNTYLIISAHYDHLGIGPAVNGDSVYNGVQDNAMGVAALLQLAKALKIHQYEIKRSVIFIFLTGEEKGLIGSGYYIDHPVIPLYKTIADINVDGIASFDEFKSIIGVGTEFSSLNKFFNETADSLGLFVGRIPDNFDNINAFYLSDQLSFALAGMPSVLTMDGIDYKNISREEGIERFINFSENIYHTPFDDLKQKINFDAAIEHINFLYRFSFNLLNSEEVPEWNKEAPFIGARLRSIAEKR